MERGQIIFWTFTTENVNRGRIGGCFGNVQGDRFNFNIRDVADAGLAAFLRSRPGINRVLDCDPNADALWVQFIPEGTRATNIRPD